MTPTAPFIVFQKFNIWAIMGVDPIIKKKKTKLIKARNLETNELRHMVLS